MIIFHNEEMRHTKFYTAILTTVMVLNICRYQMPYIEYNLFHDYIVENLCIQRNKAGNSCQGKCHLEKQINRVNETDENTAANQTETKQVKCEIPDCIIINTLSFTQISSVKIRQSQLVILHFARVFIDIPVPPPQHFC